MLEYSCHLEVNRMKKLSSPSSLVSHHPVQSQWGPKTHCHTLPVIHTWLPLTPCLSDACLLHLSPLWKCWLCGLMDTQKWLLINMNLCEMDPNCGDLMKLTSCFGWFPFVLVLLREQLGFFSQILRVIQPWSSKSNHSLKSDQVSLAQRLEQKCITLQVH